MLVKFNLGSELGYAGSEHVANSNVANSTSEFLHTFTVFPVKPWTPEKISGMFIVSRLIRCEMKPQKITDKPQNGLITTWHETTSSLFHPRGIFNFALFKYWSFSFSIAALLSPKNRYERHFTKSEVNQEDRISASESKKKWTNQKRCFSVFVSRAVQKVMLVGCDWWFSIRTFL